MKSSWRDIHIIDAHVHILPQEIHDDNPDAQDEFSYAVASDYAAIMARYNIQRAVIMPFNDPCLMSMAFTAEAVHHNLKTMCEDYNGRFFALQILTCEILPKKASGKSDARWAPLLFAGLSFTRITAVCALTTPITMRSPRARLRWTAPSLSIPIPLAPKSRIALPPAPPQESSAG